ncbi:MAG: hypothetical protein ACI4HI_18765 [Lachnospiraceae bacterium]
MNKTVKRLLYFGVEALALIGILCFLCYEIKTERNFEKFEEKCLEKVKAQDIVVTNHDHVRQITSYYLHEKGTVCISEGDHTALKTSVFGILTGPFSVQQMQQVLNRGDNVWYIDSPGGNAEYQIDFHGLDCHVSQLDITMPEVGGKMYVLSTSK